MTECTLSGATLKTTEQPLINQYKTGETAYFSSPGNTILAKPPFANLLDAGMRNINQQVTESLRLATELGHSAPIIIGAIPFDISRPSALKLSTNFNAEKASISTIKTNLSNPAMPGLITASSTTSSPAPELGKFSIKPEPAPEQFKKSVFDALDRFSRKELDKVVLSRTLQITTEHSVDIGSVLKRLEQSNQNGYTFAVSANKKDNVNSNKTLLGASPELLIQKRGNKIIANPLAGSEPRQQNKQAEKEICERLINSPKDRHEHALVIQSIVDALTPFCKKLNVPDNPELIHTETMWHLSTRIEGELKSSDITSLEIAMAMHPTPAIGGYPEKAARKAINEIEEYDRNLFTGMVGWCNCSGDGEWVVTIRCAEIEGKQATLYAGAGIVEGSIPEKELNETGAKFNTMLNALGIKERGQNIE